MFTKTIKLNNVLVDLKVDRSVAKEASEPILTKDEAFLVLPTKEDLHRQTRWIVGTFDLLPRNRTSQMGLISW